MHCYLGSYWAHVQSKCLLCLDNPDEDEEALGDVLGLGPSDTPRAEIPPESRTSAAAAPRAVRRRVGASREESRAVTVEEPETELTTEVEVPSPPPADPPDLPAKAPATQAGEGAVANDSMLATSLRAFASHFWSYKEEKLWNSLPGQKEYESLRCFFAERIETPETSVWRKRRKNYSSEKQKEKHGKNLVYSRCPEDVQKELDKTREKEWNKWKEFSAAIAIDKKQLEELVREGHQIVPTQWVEVDKNFPQRLLVPSVEPKYKSRFVVRGDLEQGDPRSDSPTASIKAPSLHQDVSKYAVRTSPTHISKEKRSIESFSCRSRRAGCLKHCALRLFCTILLNARLIIPPCLSHLPICSGDSNPACRIRTPWAESL